MVEYLGTLIPELFYTLHVWDRPHSSHHACVYSDRCEQVTPDTKAPCECAGGDCGAGAGQFKKQTRCQDIGYGFGCQTCSSLGGPKDCYNGNAGVVACMRNPPKLKKR
eukprot:TRINITY_DN20137_c0_g1_i1.p1 TRINITY_DN20137_c0_g1~~TRINITY_DN20137_c0_g1_i1.p1  ORF type:complete len:108 (+),score=24.29 TRINITY_DN20137_c0_g1_i1:79-402(+)